MFSPKGSTLFLIAGGLLVCSAESFPWRMQDGPPLGPSDKALCPVTGANLTITDATPSLAFQNGQKLYFASQEAADAYRNHPRAFLLSPFELPLPMPDGARGLPDLRGSLLQCPYSNETIDVGIVRSYSSMSPLKRSVLQKSYPNLVRPVISSFHHIIMSSDHHIIILS